MGEDLHLRFSGCDTLPRTDGMSLCPSGAMNTYVKGLRVEELDRGIYTLAMYFQLHQTIRWGGDFATGKEKYPFECQKLRQTKWQLHFAKAHHRVHWLKRWTESLGTTKRPKIPTSKLQCSQCFLWDSVSVLQLLWSGMEHSNIHGALGWMLTAKLRAEISITPPLTATTILYGRSMICLKLFPYSLILFPFYLSFLTKKMTSKCLSPWRQRSIPNASNSNPGDFQTAGPLLNPREWGRASIF